MGQNQLEAYLPKLITICETLGINHHIMKAIVACESGWNPYAARYEPQYSYLVTPSKFSKSLLITEATESNFQKTSWGLGQIMGANARALGFQGHLTMLIEPTLGLQYCCLFFAKMCMRRFSVIADQIAAYNAGTPVTDANGRYKNQDYVDKVLAAME